MGRDDKKGFAASRDLLSAMASCASSSSCSFLRSQKPGLRFLLLLLLLQCADGASKSLASVSPPPAAAAAGERGDGGGHVVHHQIPHRQHHENRHEQQHVKEEGRRESSVVAAASQPGAAVLGGAAAGHGRRPGSAEAGRRGGAGGGGVARLCKTTSYPEQCQKILSTLPGNAALTRQIVAASAYALRLSNLTYGAVVAAAGGGRSASWRAAPSPSGRGHGRKKKSGDDKLAEGALQDCVELMGNSMDQLRISIARVSALAAAVPLPQHPHHPHQQQQQGRGRGRGRGGRGRRRQQQQQQQRRAWLHARVMDAQVSLSAAYTLQGTCAEEVSGQHEAGSVAAALLLRQSVGITQAIAVALSLADTLQRRILHPSSASSS